MKGSKEGRIAGIAVKTAHRAPLELIDQTTVTPDDGVVGNVKTTKPRRVTFLSKEQWADAERELGKSFPWQSRRANILVEGLYMPDLLGKRVAIGDIAVQIEGETAPCGLMDEVCPGLRRALEPECRGGVHGRVEQGGPIRVGDTIRVIG